MTHLWFVRHGPTHEKRFVGWRDVPADLSDHAQLARLDAYLPREAVIVASDLQRASATADVISAGRSRQPDDRDLREFDFGRWDGKSFAEVSAMDPALSRRFWEEPGDIAPPDGESWNTVAGRVNGAIDSLVDQNIGQHIIVVAHIGVIMTQIQRANGGDAYAAMGHQIDNLSVTDMRWTGTCWALGMINHVP
ncbi:histidine phosphatase family protein [Yoonia sp. 2307UL14-13]|uniref:histidine phosphatase family protein n=1 Tax=Yoonia sp. 2307UL14-13 TaxID=3126506 RepID=UPI0030A1714A